MAKARGGTAGAVRAPVRRPAPKRREPVDWRRYSARVRSAQRVLPRFEHPLPVTVGASLVFAIAALLLLQTIGIGLGAGIADLGRSLVSTLPRSEEGTIQLAEQQVSVSGAPVLEGLPEFTKSNEIRVTGRIPILAVRPERKVVVALNGRTVTTLELGTDGRFGPAPLTLPDGSSTLSVTLVEGADVIAETTSTVVVDRVAPAISLVRPKNGDTVEGPDVIIEGKTEAGAEVTVNGRPLRPTPDGSFADRLTANAGPLAITIVAKDQAGNETKTQLSVTVKEKTSTSTVGLTLAIKLDRTKVRPSESVVAEVTATEGGKPKADANVTLQVGVITIGTYRTDSTGKARIGFAAPNHEVENVSVVVLSGGASATASLTVAK